MLRHQRRLHSFWSRLGPIQAQASIPSLDILSISQFDRFAPAPLKQV